MHINYHRTAPPCPAQQIEMEDDWWYIVMIS